MADAGWTNKLGATPGKLGVVALLAIVLVAVLLFQVNGSAVPANKSQERGEVRKKPSLPERASPSAGAAQTAVPCRELSPRPQITLEEAIQHDPFALVPALAQSAPAKPPELSKTSPHHGRPDDRSQRINQTVAALRNKGVQMVLLGGSEKLAIVGDRPIRVGDVLDGLRVISITPRGITVSEQGGK